MRQNWHDIPQIQRAAAERPLPGMQPAPADWIVVDPAYRDQMREKARLMAVRRGDVCQVRPGAEAACAELLDTVLHLIAARPDFAMSGPVVLRPDGLVATVDRADPLGTLSQLVQEDLCILQPDGAEHVLTAALLCFPASWTLAEKIGHPLSVIHDPVDPYDADVARRVQRLFDGVRVGQGLWRANLLPYADPALFQPRSVSDPRDRDSGKMGFERSERQTIFRLPQTGAVVFSIHTTVTDRPA